MLDIKIHTTFDITETNIRHQYSPSHMPFTTIAEWQQARNQQRNWDTVNQLISLRSLPEHIKSPTISIVNDTKVWSFGFSIESIEQLETVEGTLNLLKSDFNAVPMITSLTESNTFTNSVFDTASNSPNIWFES